MLEIFGSIFYFIADTLIKSFVLWAASPLFNEWFNFPIFTFYQAIVVALVIGFLCSTRPTLDVTEVQISEDDLPDEEE